MKSNKPDSKEIAEALERFKADGGEVEQLKDEGFVRPDNRGETRFHRTLPDSGIIAKSAENNRRRRRNSSAQRKQKGDSKKFGDISRKIARYKNYQRLARQKDYNKAMRHEKLTTI